MREKVKFTIGSEVFFNGMPGFSPKDSDVLYVMEGWDSSNDVMNLRKGDGRDLFFVPDWDKERMIESTLRSGVPMRAGKFLVPKYASYIGMTVSDLRRLEPLMDSMDEKHSYEKVIYDSYIENGDFVLTDSQRESAYVRYVKERSSK